MIEAALDSSQGMALAITEDGNLLASEYHGPRGRQSREMLTPSLKDIFERCEVSPNGIARWTVGLGPGSFTGIRIGLAYVKGICLQSAARIRGLPTSYAIATQAAAGLKAGDRIAVLHDARRQQVITTLFTRDKTGLRLTEKAHIPAPYQLDTICSESARLVTLQPDRVAPNLPETCRSDLIALEELHAEMLLCAPEDLYQVETTGDTSSQALPVYVRPAVFVKPGRAPRVKN